MPEISADGLVYTIPLRQGITFHDGSKMDSSDVLASLALDRDRHARQGRGQGHLQHRGARRQHHPHHAQAALLAADRAAGHEQRRRRHHAQGQDRPGPDRDRRHRSYQLKARVPDQYIQLVRFDGYKQREGEPDGYGGARKQYLDEIRFVPVSNANTRTEAAVAGQFDYVDSLPVESLDKLKGGRSDPVMLKPFGWPRLVLNTARHHVQPGRAPGRAAGAERRGHAVRRLRQQGVLQAQRRPVPRGLPLGHVAGRQGLQQGRHRRRQEAAGRRQRRRQEDPHPDQPAVRVPLQDGAGRRRVPEGRRLHGGHAGGGLGHADAAPPGSGRVGHLHHPQRVPARARPDRLPVQGRAGLVGHAAPRPGHGRVQPGAHPGRTRQALGRRAAGRV